MATEQTAATVVDKPRPSGSIATVVARSDSAAGPDSGASTTAPATPEQAMGHTEVLRMRALAGSWVVLCVAGVSSLLVLGGDPTARWMHLAAVGATGIYAAAYWAIARDPTQFRQAAALGLVAVSVTANVTGFYYWGVFSPYVGVVTVSAYIFASGSSDTIITVELVVTLLGHLGFGIPIVAGWIHDVALFRPFPTAGWLEQCACLGLTDMMMIGSVILGRRARTDTRGVLGQHAAAIRAIAQRDALLAEARAEMRDLQAAAGRFTGQRLGPFVLGDVLGRGAMGEVYRATGDDGAAVAIKLLAPGRLQDEAAHKRFEREVRLVAGLSSPHIVRAVDVSPPGASLPWLAMELLEGVDLGALIKQQPVRPLAEVVDIVTHVARGLDAAHAAGIVHRDLKPQNVFAAGPATAPTWKVLDFGVSKLVDDSESLSRDHIVGTPSYMAPEQARNEPVDARTDVYALGVLAYRLLTGMPPVMPGEPHAMLYEVIHRMPPRPATLVELPAIVEAVLAVAIAKQPTQRFASAGELARALADAAAGRIAPELAARADAILARTPWGHWLRRQRDRRTTTT